MFTGIIQEIGTVCAIEKLNDSSLKIGIDSNFLNSKTTLGDSISVNGVCLTVESKQEDYLVFTAIKETLDKTNLNDLSIGSKVNLEESASAEKLIGGHLISGHIDNIETVIAITPSENWKVIRFSLNPKMRKFIVEKGSISINGVSLTVSSLGSEWFEVSLIPTTLKMTNLEELNVGNKVNIEFDQVGKYIARNFEMMSETKNV